MPSFFSQEWRDCLRAHYSYVVRQGDQGTEKTLHNVMIEAGFNEDEVKQLYVLATAHVDDVDADFVPDLAILEEETTPVAVAVPEVIEVPEIEEAPLPDEIIADELEAEDAEADFEPEAEEGDQESDEPLDVDPDATQLSLF